MTTTINGLIWRWNAIKEQLMALSQLQRIKVLSQDIICILNDESSIQNMTLETFNNIIYFLLGIINLEERDKQIRWPLVNIQSQAKFRKAVSSMVNDFQIQYTWANISKVAASHFKNPRGDQRNVLDFILGLNRLAIHIVLNDESMMLMSSSPQMNVDELQISYEIICKDRRHVENQIMKNLFHTEEFESIIKDVEDKCIKLKQENDGLRAKLMKIKKAMGNHGFSMSDLQKNYKEKLNELEQLNKEIAKYTEASSETFTKALAAKKSISLQANDFGCTAGSEINEATNRACENISDITCYFKQKHSSVDEEGELCDVLKTVKTLLIKERDCLQMVLSKSLPQKLNIEKCESNIQEIEGNFLSEVDLGVLQLLI